MIEHRKTMEDFIDDVSLTSGVARLIVEKVLKATFECIKQSVALDEQVRLPKFGTFSPVARPARTFRNINTGKQTTLPPCRSIKFTPSKTLIPKLQDPKPKG